MEHIKGELEYIGSTSIVAIEHPSSRRLSIAVVLPEAIDIDTACKYPIDFEANAKEFVRRWNAFEKDGIVDRLAKACEAALPFVVAHDITCEVVSGAALQLQDVIAEAAIAKVS